MYELMKKAKSLSREEKISFLEDIETLIVLAETPRKEVLRNLEIQAIDDVNSDGFVSEAPPKEPNKRRQSRPMDTKQNPDRKKKRYVPENYTHLNQDKASDPFGHENMAGAESKIKTAKKLHDPETPEEMADLVRLLEKVMAVDGDISYETLSVFLVPLLRGSQRVGLKNYQIVGLMKKLCRLSRKFQRLRKRQRTHRDKFEVRKDFNDCLKTIKTRLEIKAEIKRPVVKTANINMHHRDALRMNIMNLKSMGLQAEEAKAQVEMLANALDYDVMSLVDSVISEVYS